MVRLQFERDLPVPAERAWPHLAEPAWMSRWSLAPVESVALGDGAHPAGVGALRLVRLPGWPALALEEVVEEAEAPHRFAYRVVRGAPVRRHAGRMEIEDRGGASRLSWTVDIESGIPGLERIAEMRLRPAIETSLDRLVSGLAAGAGSGAPPPPRRSLDESSLLVDLTAAAAACAAEQRTAADQLLAAGDDRGWFARVYQYVSERMLADAGAARFRHPAWLLRLIPVFHRLYAVNLERRLARRPGEVEAHWRRAMVATERLRARGKSRFEAAVTAIFLGMRAHIEHDLPRALCEVHVRHYAGRCDYARFRADYLRMGDIFVAAGDRLLGDLPRAGWPLRARLLDRATPAVLRARMLERRVYPIASRRREAFERGLALVTMTESLATGRVVR